MADKKVCDRRAVTINFHTGRHPQSIMYPLGNPPQMTEYSFSRMGSLLSPLHYSCSHYGHRFLVNDHHLASPADDRRPSQNETT
jgi:hypothetical protein